MSGGVVRDYPVVAESRELDSPATSSAVRERPILFSGEMVRALLDGRKTQTRRVATKLNPAYLDDHCAPRCREWQENRIAAVRLWSPFGQPGDQLWVRETLTMSGGYVQYVADEATTRRLWPPTWMQDPRPSIHMPRDWARITLEVTGVRLERLQGISEDDAEAEGVGEAPIHGRRELFATLWDRLNAKRGYGWAANPWVWVVGFRMTTQISVLPHDSEGGA